MANYVTETDIQTHGFQLGSRDTARVASLCELFSRLFDRAAGVAPNYFTPVATDATATARVFWGDGTDLLKLWPYQSNSITTVTMPTGWTVPEYVELSAQPDRSNGFDFGLLRTYGDNDSRFNFVASGQNDGAVFALDFSGDLRVGWPDGIKVTVTAKWGFDAVPADVKLAVIESVIQGMRGMDQAYMRVTNLDTNTVTNAGALTPRAQMVAEQYRAMRASFA